MDTTTQTVEHRSPSVSKHTREQGVAAGMASPCLSSSDESDVLSHVDLNEDQEWLDVESEIEETVFRSLVDGEQFTHLKAMFAHVKATASVDFLQICRTLELDYLETVKLVNYIRLESRNGPRPLEITSKEPFADPSYLKPALEDDAVLYRLDELDHLAEFQPSPEQEATLTEARLVEMDQRAFNERLGQNRSAPRPFMDLFDALDANYEASDTAGSDREEDAMSHKHHLLGESEYFEGYGNLAVHMAMINDNPRTGAYARFIDGNKDLFQGKLVLDIGCGTGILSIMCAKAGAREVVAIDNAGKKLMEVARTVAADNKVSQQIRFIDGDLDKTTLPHKQYDVIVSEWMGYSLLYEGMLKTVVNAREKYLAPGGLMVPSHASIHLAAVSDEGFMHETYYRWANVHGINLIHLAPSATMAVQADIPSKAVISRGATMRTLAIAHLTSAELEEYQLHGWQDDVSLQIYRQPQAGLHGFALWFDVYFTRDDNLHGAQNAHEATQHGIKTLRTGPHDETTHWEQTFLPATRDGLGWTVATDDVVRASLRLKPPREDRRGLDVEMQWGIVRKGEVVAHVGRQQKREWNLSGYSVTFWA